mmetsp:Transcript_27292/g.43914  ORF Transcript_27292/g.43914 Transcript_27292/m.43914 type:complete len:211 (-) Transcript_27292:1273-1905(-)
MASIDCTEENAANDKHETGHDRCLVLLRDFPFIPIPVQVEHPEYHPDVVRRTARPRRTIVIRLIVRDEVRLKTPFILLRRPPGIGNACNGESGRKQVTGALSPQVRCKDERHCVEKHHIIRQIPSDPVAASNVSVREYCLNVEEIVPPVLVASVHHLLHTEVRLVHSQRDEFHIEPNDKHIERRDTKKAMENEDRSLLNRFYRLRAFELS